MFLVAHFLATICLSPGIVNLVLKKSEQSGRDIEEVTVAAVGCRNDQQAQIESTWQGEKMEAESEGVWWLLAEVGGMCEVCAGCTPHSAAAAAAPSLPSKVDLQSTS